jgi:hypothetical protein
MCLCAGSFSMGIEGSGPTVPGFGGAGFHFVVEVTPG